MTDLDKAYRSKELPNVDMAQMRPFDPEPLRSADNPGHKPGILLLFGSLRKRSFSRLFALEAERLLKWHGCEMHVFDPAGLPLPDAEEPNHPKVQELHDLEASAECPSGHRGIRTTIPARHPS